MVQNVSNVIENGPKCPTVPPNWHKKWIFGLPKNKRNKKLDKSHLLHSVVQVSTIFLFDLFTLSFASKYVKTLGNREMQNLTINLWKFVRMKCVIIAYLKFVISDKFECGKWIAYTRVRSNSQS